MTPYHYLHDVRHQPLSRRPDITLLMDHGTFPLPRRENSGTPLLRTRPGSGSQVGTARYSFTTRGRRLGNKLPLDLKILPEVQLASESLYESQGMHEAQRNGLQVGNCPRQLNLFPNTPSLGPLGSLGKREEDGETYVHKEMTLPNLLRGEASILWLVVFPCPVPCARAEMPGRRIALPI